MNTAKHAAQDIWEFLSGHPTPTTTKTRPLTYTTYAHKEPRDPTVITAHEKKEQAQQSLLRAKAAVMQAKKYGDDEALAKAREKRGERKRELDEVNERELEAILEVNRLKRERRSAEKGGSVGGSGKGKQTQKVKFQEQQTPSGKVSKGGSDDVRGKGGIGGNDAKVVPADWVGSQKSKPNRTSKSLDPNETTAPLATEMNRQLGNNERTFLEGLAPEDIGSEVQIPNATPARVSRAPPGSRAPARGQVPSSRVPPPSKPPSGDQSKTIVPPDATIPLDNTEFNRKLGDMNRTQVEGMQKESVVAGWNQSKSGSSTGLPSKSRAPASQPPSTKAAKTITPSPSTPIPQNITEMNRPIGDMNRTYIEGVNTPSEYARWNQTNSGRKSSSRAPASQPPSTKAAKTITPSPSTPIPQNITEMNRPIGDMNRTYIEGVHTPSEYAKWNQTNAGQPPPSRAPTSRRPPASMPPASKTPASSIPPRTAIHNPSNRKPASNPPQTAIYNPSIPQIQTEMGRQLGNNERTYIAGMTPKSNINPPSQQS